MEAKYMGWVDFLHEVGAPIRKDRDRLVEQLREANRLEIQAETLRGEVLKERAALMARIGELWNADEVVAAQAKAGEADIFSPVYVGDTDLRAALLSLDGQGSALTMLRIYRAHVVRQKNLLSTATDEERRQTLNRLLDWWNYGARFVFEANQP